MWHVTSRSQQSNRPRERERHTYTGLPCIVRRYRRKTERFPAVRGSNVVQNSAFLHHILHILLQVCLLQRGESCLLLAIFSLRDSPCIKLALVGHEEDLDLLLEAHGSLGCRDGARQRRHGGGAAVVVVVVVAERVEG